MSSFDQRQRFTMNFVYDLDFLPRCAEQVAEAADRGLAAERHLHPGQRSTHNSLLERRGPSGSGESSNDRPNLVGNPNDGPKRWDAWFNTAAFVPAPSGAFRQRRA